MIDAITLCAGRMLAQLKWGFDMQVAKVTVADETLIVRAGEEQQAVRALAGDGASDADAQIEHIEMSEEEFARLPEYQ
ncbi:hypothetical protein [Burkholderia ambifaria]|nr:hypothetical protein [Burkholderia ambifaria]